MPYQIYEQTTTQKENQIPNLLEFLDTSVDALLKIQHVFPAGSIVVN